MATAERKGRLPREREDHFMRLPGAQVVSTRALLMVRENIRAAIEARAMICIYGQAGRGKSLAANTSLRELAPKLTRRIQFRARPSTRDLRRELFHALGLQGRPPGQPIEFDRSSSTGCCAALWRRRTSWSVTRRSGCRRCGVDEPVVSLAGFSFLRCLVGFVGGGVVVQVLP